MASSDNARKLLVRTALVTGSTVATLFGAQTLAVIDTQTLVDMQAAETLIAGQEPVSQPDAVVATPTASVVIQRAAPSVVILRRPGTTRASDQQAAAVGAASSQAIQPPSPVALANPAPVIVQQGPAPVAAPAPVVVQQPPRTKTRPSR